MEQAKKIKPTSVDTLRNQLLINSAVNNQRKGRNTIVQPQYHIKQTSGKPVKAFTMKNSMHTSAVDLNNLLKTTASE